MIVENLPVTVKIAPLPRSKESLLVGRMKCALSEARCSEIGDDITDALQKLIAKTQRRELDLLIAELPDITDAAEAA